MIDVYLKDVWGLTCVRRIFWNYSKFLVLEEATWVVYISQKGLWFLMSKRIALIVWIKSGLLFSENRGHVNLRIAKTSRCGAAREMLLLQPCDIFLQRSKTMEGKFKPCTFSDKTSSAMGVVLATFVYDFSTLSVAITGPQQWEKGSWRFMVRYKT